MDEQQYERRREFHNEELKRLARSLPRDDADVDHAPGCPGPAPRRESLGTRPDGSPLTRLVCRMCERSEDYRGALPIPEWEQPHRQPMPPFDAWNRARELEEIQRSIDEHRSPYGSPSPPDPDPQPLRPPTDVHDPEGMTWQDVADIIEADDPSPIHERLNYAHSRGYMKLRSRWAARGFPLPKGRKRAGAGHLP